MKLSNWRSTEKISQSTCKIEWIEDKTMNERTWELWGN